MYDDLSMLASLRSDGVVSAADLAALGWHPATVQARVKSGELVRVRHGYYALRTTWSSASPADRYRALVSATASSAAKDVVVSHHSAAALHRLPFIGRMPRAVHLHDAAASGGRRGDRIVVHRAGGEPGTVRVDGVRVTSLLRTVVDIATVSPWDVSVPMLDAACVERSCSARELWPVVNGGSRPSRPNRFSRNLSASRRVAVAGAPRTPSGSPRLWPPTPANP